MSQVGETTSESRHKRKIRGKFYIRKALCKIDVCSEYRVMPQIIRKNAYTQVSEFDRSRILPIESVSYRFLNSLIALVEIQPLPIEYGINGLLRTILNGMQDLNALPCCGFSWQYRECGDSRAWSDKLDTRVAQCHFFRRVPFCVNYSDDRIRFWKLREERSFPACAWYRHRDLHLVWAGPYIHIRWCI